MPILNGYNVFDKKVTGGGPKTVDHPDVLVRINGTSSFQRLVNALGKGAGLKPSHIDSISWASDDEYPYGTAFEQARKGYGPSYEIIVERITHLIEAHLEYGDVFALREGQIDFSAWDQKTQKPKIYRPADARFAS